MNNQQDLDKWISSSIEYYNLKSNKSMKTTEERFQQLEQAHSRLFNQFNTLHQDFFSYKEAVKEQVQQLKDMLATYSINLQQIQVQPLPEKLQANNDYTAVISEIVTSTPTKWKDMDYTNWEVKLEGKDKYVFVAFIPTEHQLTAGDLVRFTYAHPFQLRKLKKI